MRKNYVYSALVTITVLALLSSELVKGAEAKKLNQPQLKITMSVYRNEEMFLNKVNQQLSIKQEPKQQEPVVETVAINKRPTIKDVSLSDSDLDYIWNAANKSGIPYTMLLSVAKTESNFDHTMVSSTDDVGLFQLHESTAQGIAEQLGLKRYSLKNTKTNTDFAVFQLSYLRDFWKSKGYSDEMVYKLTIISYNRGIGGTFTYLRHHSPDENTYLRAVRSNKSQIEQGVI